MPLSVLRHFLFKYLKNFTFYLFSVYVSAFNNSEYVFGALSSGHHLKAKCCIQRTGTTNAEKKLKMKNFNFETVSSVVALSYVIFSCEGAALEVLIYVCLYVCHQVENIKLLKVPEGSGLNLLECFVLSSSQEFHSSCFITLIT